MHRGFESGRRVGLGAVALVEDMGLSPDCSVRGRNGRVGGNYNGEQLKDPNERMKKEKV